MPDKFIPDDWSEDDAPYEDDGDDYEEDPLDASIRVILEGVRGESHIRYQGAPGTMDQLLEAIQTKYEELLEENSPRDVCIAVRESCQTGAIVVVVYERGGLQYHWNTRNLYEGFDLDSFKIDVKDFSDGEVLEIDHYVSDV